MIFCISKRNISVAVFLFLACFNVFSYELSFKLTPSIFFPNVFTESLTDREKTEGVPDVMFSSVGFGGFLDVGFTFNDFFNIGPEVGFFFLEKNNSSSLKTNENKNVDLIPIGIQSAFFLYPASRFQVTLGLSAGVSIVSSSNTVTSTADANSVSANNLKPFIAPFYRVFAEGAFRLNPDMNILVNTSIQDFQIDSWFKNPLAAGITFGVGFQYKLDTSKANGMVTGTLEQDEPVFPLFYTVYKSNPVGTITIANNETAEIRNVQVKFRAGEYTSSELLCGTIPVLKKGKTENLSLLADFNETILQFSEAGKIPGELVIDYEILGKKKKAVSQIIVPVYNRNQVRWTDNSVIASYISTSSQEVLKLSKYLVGIARNHLRTGLNRNMQFAMYVFEGVRLAGVQCIPDASTPYAESHLDPSILDYIQYPFQTLKYMTGDADDVGMLMLALLESTGINAAYIPLEDDFIVVIDLGIDAASAGRMFDGYDRIMVIDDNAWIPLSMRALKEGFINSWYKAITDIQIATDNEEDFEFILLTDAWQYYPPAGFSSGENISVEPSEESLTKSVDSDIGRYITTEFGPQIAAIQMQIRAEGPSIQLYNNLGILYVRAGMYSNAIPVYEQSASLGSVTAMNNLGNIYSIQKRFQEAKKWYEKALATEPENKTAAKGLNRVLGELGN